MDARVKPARDAVRYCQRSTHLRPLAARPTRSRSPHSPTLIFLSWFTTKY